MFVDVTHTAGCSQGLTANLRRQDQYTRKKLLPSTAAAGHSVFSDARFRHSAARRNSRATARRRQKLVVGAVSTEQNTTALTPLLQLQKRLESSGASLDTLNLSYKQCVAARKLRHGEVLPYIGLTSLVPVQIERDCAACFADAPQHSRRLGCHPRRCSS